MQSIPDIFTVSLTIHNFIQSIRVFSFIINLSFGILRTRLYCVTFIRLAWLIADHESFKSFRMRVRCTQHHMHYIYFTLLHLRHFGMLLVYLLVSSIYSFYLVHSLWVIVINIIITIFMWLTSVYMLFFNGFVYSKYSTLFTLKWALAKHSSHSRIH